MSHVVTLVDFYMPEVEENLEETAHYKAQIAETKEALAQSQGGNSFALRLILNQLQSKVNPLDRAADCEIGELMAPFCENTEDPEYLEFIDQTDDLKRDYDRDTIDCIQLPDGTIVPEYDYRLCEKYRIKDGKVYQVKAGQLGHEKRTKKAKKMRALTNYPAKRFYLSLERYAEEHCGYTYDRECNAYGYYSNPNAYWDWYSIGGRWPFQFLVKETAERITGERSWDDEDTECKAPEGYVWVCGARKKDIAWELMKECELQNARKTYALLAHAFNSGEVPKDCPWWRITEDGVFSFLTQLYFKGESEEEYLRRNGLAAEQRMLPGAYSFIRDGEWNAKGDMGWWGISSNDKEPKTWRQMMADYIDSIPDDHFIVGIDCHI